MNTIQFRNLLAHWPVFVVSGIVMFAATAEAQNGSFERLLGPQLTAIADSTAVAHFPVTIDPDDQFDSDEVLARAEANGIASVPLANAISHAEFTALSPTSIGDFTFTPTTSVSSFHSGLASATFIKDDEVIENGEAFTENEILANNATSAANFQLNFDESPQGNFHGFLYLVGFENTVVAGHAGNVSAGLANNSTVSSAISIGEVTYGALARYRSATDDWLVIANLPGGLSITLTEASVNRHFDFVVPVVDGEIFTFTSTTMVGASTSAIASVFFEENAMASVNATTAGLAWGVATPIDVPPLPGDFDGDGDVDNDDFDIWFENQPIDQGGSGPQGDADLDGDIDNDDLAIWLANTETPGIPGDYNGDDLVDAADYTVWRDTLGSNMDLRADGDLNGIVENLDYDVWKLHFGIPSASGNGLGSGVAAPEPLSSLLLLIGALGFAAVLQRNRREEA